MIIAHIVVGKGVLRCCQGATRSSTACETEQGKSATGSNIVGNGIVAHKEFTLIIYTGMGSKCKQAVDHRIVAQYIVGTCKRGHGNGEQNTVLRIIVQNGATCELGHACLRIVHGNIGNHVSVTRKLRIAQDQSVIQNHGQTIRIVGKIYKN